MEQMLTTGDILEALTAVTVAQTMQGVQLAERLSVSVEGLVHRPITGGVVDSRQAFPGALFVALPGDHVDGHGFVGDAFANGAALALIEHEVSEDYPVLDLRRSSTAEEMRAGLVGIDPGSPFCLLVENSLIALQTVAGYWRGKLNVRVIGITGSVGKSTSKEIIADVLCQRYNTLRNPGNLNNEIGLPLTLLSLTGEHERVVLEMGFYVPGEIALLCELAKPQVGVITMIGTVHAERAGSQEAIARGKAELILALPPAPVGAAVLNYDDPWVRSMADLTQAKIFFYGLSPQADLWADNIEGMGLDGIAFQLHYRDDVLHLHVPMIGRHSVHTVLRSAAVGLIEGLSWPEIIRGLHSERTQLRLVSVPSKTGAMILDDTYNASPESTLAALNLLDELDGRKIAVLGDMLELGQYERQGHESVGVRAAEVVDKLITLGEKGKLIAQAAWQAGLSRKKIAVFSDPMLVIEHLENSLLAGDVVLVKGSRGLQMDKIVAALEERE